MNTFGIFGLTTLFKLADTLPVLTRSRTDVDELNDSWQAPAENSLVEGDVHPERPGMIIDRVTVTEEVPGIAYVINATSLGSADNSLPTKLINQGKKRTLDAGWDERTVESISWHADWKDCTADATTEFITCAAHGYLNGQRIVFARLTGGAGITPQSASSLGTIYYVIARTTNTFQISTSAGGSAVNITSTMSAGQVIAAEYALGSPHPTFPYLYLIELSLSDAYTRWNRAQATYRGLEEDKPYKRLITCNGQSMSSSEPIYWDFPDGGSDLQRRAVNLPQIVVADHYLTIGTLPTASVPWSQSEGGTPPDPPAIRTIVISGSIDQITYQWPAYWSRMSVAHADTLNSQLLPSLQTITSEYRWPVLLN